MEESPRQYALRRINYLTSETDALYHQSSRRFGISDSVSIVLYTLYDQGGQCLLSDVYKNSGISKQTVNSAIRTLEAEGALFLEADTGRSKRVRLTESGWALTKRTAARLAQAEADAFDGWADEEVAEYIRLMEKYTQCLRHQIEQL